MWQQTGFMYLLNLCFFYQGSVQRSITGIHFLLIETHLQLLCRHSEARYKMERLLDICLWPYSQCNAVMSASDLLTLSPVAEHTKKSVLTNQITVFFSISWLMPQAELRQRHEVVFVLVCGCGCVLPGLNSAVWIHTLRLFYCCSCNYQEPKWSKTETKRTV